MVQVPSGECTDCWGSLHGSGAFRGVYRLLGGACRVQVPSGECTDCWGELAQIRCLQVSVQTVGGNLHGSGAFR